MAKHAHAPRVTQPELDLSFIQKSHQGTRYIFRGDEAAKLEASGVLGVSLPQQALTSHSHQGLSALWLGPDEVLLISESAEDLKARLAPMSAVHSLVDVSHRQWALTMSHPKAAWLLEAGCPLDLSLKAFPVGMCTRTQYEKTEIVLWRRREDCFQVEVWRSFSEYLEGLWAQVAVEL